MKKINLYSSLSLGILVILFTCSTPAYAISGACSGHKGVNYSAGADSDGSVICNDGWRNSSVLSQDMGTNVRSGYPSTYQTPTYTPPRVGVSKTTMILVQKKLTELGYGKLTADGKYGLKTKNAVKKFQAANGLKADGVVGKKTLVMMEIIK
jgi:hypothetical protein